MVKLFKLVTGENVIADGELVPKMNGGSSWQLKKPVVLVMSHEGVGMAPFAPFLKNDVVHIEQSFVVYSEELDQEVSNAYNAKFGTGIVLPGMQF